MSLEDIPDFFSENQECFCGSGRPFGICHKGFRFSHPNQIAIEHRKINKWWEGCGVFEGGKRCSNPVIRSHSTQRRGALLDISENAHVLTVPRNKHSKSLLLDDANDFARVSAKQASTFYGICADHDQKLFDDIENNIKMSYRTFVGLAERTILYEAIESTKTSLWSFYLLKYAQFDFPFDIEIGREELENMRHYSGYTWQLLARLQAIKLRRSAREFKYIAVEFEESLPFCGTGCFCIELGFDGSRIQDFSTRQKFNYAQVSISRSSEGRTLFLLSAVCDENPKAAKRLLSSLLKQPRGSMGDSALRSMIVHTENIYFQPTWLQSLDKSLQSELLKRYNYGTDFLVGQVKASDTLSTPLLREFSPKVATVKHNLGKLM